MSYRTVSRAELITEYCTRQDATPEALASRLDVIVDKFAPDGFMLLECAMLDSSRLGDYVILPYGGRSTYPTVPDRPISPRGLASDMSTVKWISPARDAGATTS